MINIQITTEAVNWYKTELEMKNNTHIRYFVRYGDGGNIPGFSLGIRFEQPIDLHTSTEKEGIVFFVESKDLWYFEDKNLDITLNKEMMEPRLSYI